MPFTHLHVHTEYSMLDGLSRIDALVKRAKDQGMDSLGITDHGGMYGVVDFYQACTSAGIKPIIGCELYVASGSRLDHNAADKSPYHLTVLAQNNTGYKNLMKLVTKANLEGFYYKPRIDKEILAEHAEGLVVLSGCPSAELSRLIMDGSQADAEELVRWYQGTVPNFYLELQRHENLPFLDGLNAGLLNIAEKLDVPLVATNDLHYVAAEDAPLQDVMVCIQTNTTISDESRLKMSDESYYLKDPGEMAALFPDLPEAIANTEKIAASCQVELDFSTLHLPQYHTPEGEDADGYLRRLCWQGFSERYADGGTKEAKQRLSYELDVITETQYPNYFLVVWDIAAFARRCDIIFGVRGSAASSLALYCLGITEIDPLDYALVFERFLNIERKEMPDIDMDFQDDRREEAIRYVTEKYGADHVAQIITFGTLGAKAAIRDSGRALGIPLAEVDRLAKLVPTRVGMTLQQAYDTSPEMIEAYTTDPTLRKLLDTAFGLEGVVRHSSTHAAAVVISEDPLTDHVPLQRPTKGDERGAAMTQYPMGPVAKLGLLKMDFLGLINYTILSDAIALIRDRRGTDIKLKDIPFDDEATFALLASAETTAVFQLESPGMRRHIRNLHPESLAELAAMVALYRPGPMEHIDRFIDSKFGRVPIEYPHPALEGILKETYGIIVYQDQVLHVLRTFAGYTLGEADIVRKAMGKKIASLMQEERENFVKGAGNLGYDRSIAEQVFDLIEPFAGYAFNKAHSVSYAVVAYWTAYFKANYPVEFMTCVLNAYEGNAEKSGPAITECTRLGIQVLPPDVSRSEVRFSIDTATDSTAAIRFGLATVKNVGEQAVTQLVAERTAAGRFTTLENFARRAGANVANRRVLESLVKVGALDGFGTRGQLLASLDSITHLIQSEAQLKDSGQTTMFDLFGQSMPTPLSGVELANGTEPTKREIALWERELLGVSITAKVLDPRHAPPDAILSRPDLDAMPENEKVLLVGRVGSVRLQFDRQERRIAFVSLEIFDGSNIDVAVWNRTYEATSQLWAEGALVQIRGPVRRRNDEAGVHCEEALIYEPPEDDEDGQPISSTEVQTPHMKEWHARTPTPSPTPAVAATPGPPAATPTGPAASSNGHSNGNGNGNGHSNGNGDGHALTTDHARRKLLINMTETDRPDEDAHLLREVLQALLDYPGTDGVDLLITSEGKPWRLEMPIITTSFCTELSDRLRQMLGRDDAIILDESTPLATL
jgi:DNA polymerase-3 subunit alpha